MYLPYMEGGDEIRMMHGKRKLLSACFCLLLLLVWPSVGLAEDITTESQTVTMQWQQYNQLKQIISAQETNLNELQSKLDKLSSNSTTLQAQLAQAREQLQKTSSSLTTAESSLQTANSDLQKQNESLQTLTAQINSIIDEKKRIKRQRDTWAAVAVIAFAITAR